MFFSLGEATNLEGKLWIQTCLIDLVSYPAWAEGLVNMYKPIMAYLMPKSDTIYCYIVNAHNYGFK